MCDGWHAADSRVGVTAGRGYRRDTSVCTGKNGGHVLDGRSITIRKSTAKDACAALEPMGAGWVAR